jgi:hypothetical protein
MEPTAESLSAISTKRQENSCLSNFLPTPPSRRTRAQLKRKDKECSGDSKKNTKIKKKS